MEKTDHTYQQLLDSVPEGAPDRAGCIDVVLFVMILTGQKKGPVTIEELSEHFPNRDCSALVCTAISVGLLQIAIDGGVGIELGKRALDIIRQ